VSRYRFVSAMKAEGFPVQAACEVAEVSTSAYYDWTGRQAAWPSVTEWEEALVMNEMVDVHRQLDDTYGSPRMMAELRRRGYCVNHKRTERLMAEHSIVAVGGRRPAQEGAHDDPRRERPAAARPRAPGLLGWRTGQTHLRGHHLRPDGRGLAVPCFGPRSREPPAGRLRHG
jgi:hypothetical protein